MKTRPVIIDLSALGCGTIAGVGRFYEEKDVEKHTAGPWMVSQDVPTRVVVANGVEVNENQGDDVNICQTDADMFQDENHNACIANARLIAAAPELLSALMHLESAVLEHWDEIKAAGDTAHILSRIDQARAAIKKAGGSP